MILNREFRNRIMRTVSVWAVKQLLTSIPAAGLIFKLIFFAVDLVKEIRQHLDDQKSEPWLWARSCTIT